MNSSPQEMNGSKLILDFILLDGDASVTSGH